VDIRQQQEGQEQQQKGSNTKQVASHEKKHSSSRGGSTRPQALNPHLFTSWLLQMLLY
jgi:hypothetical protein